MKKGNLIWGLFLILFGILILLNRYMNLNIFHVETLWPFIVLIIGLIFETSYFISRKSPGVLVPGGILTTIGLLFLFETLTNWRFSGRTWPVYPLSVAIGLFQLYLFGGRERGLLIPVGILGGVSLVAFSIIIFGKILSGILIPVVLILIGIYVIYSGLKK